MKREARKLLNRLNKFNEFANEYPCLFGEIEADGGHHYQLMHQYTTGKYPTIEWRWNPYRSIDLLNRKVLAATN